MTLQPRFYGFPGDECICGRRASVRHCPACGSITLYGYAKPDYYKDIHGDIKLVDGLFRCRSCSHRFIDSDRQFCDAPPVSIVLAKLKVERLKAAQKQGEYLNKRDATLASAIEKIESQVATDTIEIQEGKEPVKQPEVVIARSEVDILFPLNPETREVLGDKAETPSEPLPHDTTLTRAEYDVADRAFRLEWAHMKLAGQAPTKTVDEYVERRLKGEVFQ